MGESFAFSAQKQMRRQANEIFRVSYYHYLFLYKINKIIQSDSASCCWRILVAFVTREKSETRRENSSFFPHQTLLEPEKCEHVPKVVTFRRLSPTDLLKFESLQNKIKLYCPPFCVRYEISKKNILQILSFAVGFCAFLCMSASNLFLFPFIWLWIIFYSTSKRGEKKASL